MGDMYEYLGESEDGCPKFADSKKGVHVFHCGSCSFAALLMREHEKKMEELYGVKP